MENDDKLLTLRQVAARLQVCPGTVRNHVRAGSLPPPIRIGARLPRWHAAEIAAALRSHVRAA